MDVSYTKLPEILKREVDSNQMPPSKYSHSKSYQSANKRFEPLKKIIRSPKNFWDTKTGLGEDPSLVAADQNQMTQNT